MIMLVSGASQHVVRYPSAYLGWLITPRSPKVDQAVRAGVPFACDNDCYQRLDKPAYVRMLKRIATADRTHLLYVTAPDVVADSAATLLRWRLWQPVLAYYGLPAAFVAQDGQTIDTVPWHQMAALFIGGTTRFKEAESGPLIAEAKRRGLWVHAGRVCTLRRAEIMAALGVDSFDCSIFSKMPDKFVPWMLRTLPYKQEGWHEALCSSVSI